MLDFTKCGGHRAHTGVFVSPERSVFVLGVEYYHFLPKPWKQN